MQSVKFAVLEKVAILCVNQSGKTTAKRRKTNVEGIQPTFGEATDV